MTQKINDRRYLTFTVPKDERLFYLACAIRRGELMVDLINHPPSQRGAVKDLIRRGLLSHKQGPRVYPTAKGIAYMKRVGGIDMSKPALPAVDVSRLSADEMDIRTLLVIGLNHGCGWTKDSVASFSTQISAGWVTARRALPLSRNAVLLTLTQSGHDILVSAGDKRIRSMIETCGDADLRRRYAENGIPSVPASEEPAPEQ